jgi:hypothetical protein
MTQDSTKSFGSGLCETRRKLPKKPKSPVVERVSNQKSRNYGETKIKGFKDK